MIEATLPHLSVDVLRQIQQHAVSNNHEQCRIDFFARVIFIKDLTDIENMNTAMKLSEAAIRAINTVKFYENYMDRHGRLSWETYRDHIDKATPL